jgi:hypothetical protein
MIATITRYRSNGPVIISIDDEQTFTHKAEFTCEDIKITILKGTEGEITLSFDQMLKRCIAAYYEDQKNRAIAACTW